jgi:hypothetical protein
LSLSKGSNDSARVLLKLCITIADTLSYFVDPRKILSTSVKSEKRIEL